MAVKTERRVKIGDYLCKSCRNKYDWWHRLMSGDLDQLDLSLDNDSKNQDEESTVSVFLHSIQTFRCFEADGDRCCCCYGSSYSRA